MVDLLVAHTDDDELGKFAVGVRPVQVGAVVVEVLVQEGGGDAGLDELGRRREHKAVACAVQAERRRPDDAVLVKHIIGAGAA